MKRVLRVLLATVVTVVVVMVVVPMFLGDKIGEIVKREAGKLVDARIEFSKLDVSLFRHFPQASLEITDLDVSGVGAFEGHSLVAAERIELAVDLWSVFGDSFEVEKVWLRRPSISALVLANGKANWDIMKESDEEPAATVESSTDEPTADEGSLSVALRSIMIRDAQLAYEDRESGIVLSLASLNLDLSGDLSAAETTLSLAVKAKQICFKSGNEQLVDKLDVAFSGDVAASFENNSYTLGGARLEAGGVKAKADGTVWLDDKGARAKLSLDCSGNRIGDILALVPAKELQELDVDGAIGLVAHLDGRLTTSRLPSFSVELSLDDVKMRLPEMPTITLTNGVATATRERLAIESIDLKVGRSDLALSGAVTSYWEYLTADATLGGSLKVASMLLDANELLASLGGEGSTADTTEHSAATMAEETAATTAFEVPERMNLALDASFDKVLFGKMDISQLRGAISLRNRTLALDNLSMRLFGGAASASAKYATVTREPKVSLKASFESASFRQTFEQLEIMQQVAPIFEKIEGSYSMSLAADMAFDEKFAVQPRSINGSGELRSGHFKLSNIKALDMLATAIGDTKLKAIECQEPTIIKFAIRNGAVETRPFDLRLGKTRLTLSGTTGLDTSINYNVHVAAPNNVNVDAKVKGTFASPKVSLDAAKTVETVLNTLGVDSSALNEATKASREDIVAEAEKRAAEIVELARKEAQKIVDKVSNPIAKIAAQAAADKLIKEAEAQAAKIVEEARKKVAQ